MLSHGTESSVCRRKICTGALVSKNGPPLFIFFCSNFLDSDGPEPFRLRHLKNRPNRQSFRCAEMCSMAGTPSVSLSVFSLIVTVDYPIRINLAQVMVALESFFAAPTVVIPLLPFLPTGLMLFLYL